MVIAGWVVSEIHFAATWSISVPENGRGRVSIHLLGVLLLFSVYEYITDARSKFYRLDVFKACTYIQVLLNINLIVLRVTTLITYSRPC